MVLLTLYKSLIFPNNLGTRPLNSLLKQTAVPHIFNWSKRTSTEVDRCERAKKRLRLIMDAEVAGESAWGELGAEETVIARDGDCYGRSCVVSCLFR